MQSIFKLSTIADIYFPEILCMKLGQRNTETALKYKMVNKITNRSKKNITLDNQEVLKVGLTILQQIIYILIVK